MTHPTPTLTIEEAFDAFQEHWEGFHLMRHDDLLVYTVASGYATRASIRASRFIMALNLPLIATPDEETNTFTIKFTK